jgi:hypothetical protein
MVDRKLLIAGGILVAALIIVFVIAARNRTQATREAVTRPPQLAGHTVPEATFEIDFGKRYDLHCFPAGTHEVVLRRCKILGSAGGMVQRPRLPIGDEELVMPGVYPGRWLVLELSDGRKAYVPPESVRLMEESAEAP